MDPQEINAIEGQLRSILERNDELRRYLDYADLKRQLEETDLALQDPEVWNDPEKAQALGKQKRQLEALIEPLETTADEAKSLLELLELAREEADEATLTSIRDDAKRLDDAIAKLELRRMFNDPMDPNNCFIEIQAGAGGTEAQDWASMLLRMYLRYCEQKGFETEILEESEGEVAGIKSATVKVSGDHAYGYLRTETGIHRLVRKSPFDANARRHTSFASVFVYPEVDEKIEVEINPADLRIDTYRASGAGGQHVNRTDSAVRITHIPTGIVVQCQNDRSQHKNKAAAMAMLKSRLYELELRKRREQQQALEESKSDIGWGHQIRSYVLDQSRIKDLRTGVEIGNTQAVLDGDLDPFIEAALKQGVSGTKPSVTETE
ncbi:MAG: peptide chain release factor 2 [Hydrogenophilus thermoluteolus]|nr:peptide chain release factor 2 [Hydrogenophilus thermoluteolus]MBW7655990.1 peptide chain release factor 2 [Hydrogenophilus thermoluteolus]HCO78240.1 peptide chain release factor 2 [Rhodocyclaceae bacterium]HNQ48299.1 peptide chain release factor 2 [Hydrogenophilus thermoluteolus]HNU19058.1 peptide chain release factor 2 [Hydrogenophilus thermoluteolus]